MNPEGHRDMNIHLDESLLEAARVVAQQMISEGLDGKTFESPDAGQAQFRLQTSSEGMTPLGELQEGDQTFYIGVKK